MEPKSKMEKWLEQFRSKSTVARYKSTMKIYLSTVYGLDMKGISSEELYALGDRYLSEKRDYEEDVTRFFVSIKDRPPTSIRLFLSTVRVFLAENKIKLDDDFWKKLLKKIQGDRARTMDRIPSNEELRKVIGNMDLPGKALYLLLSSSGMRIGEALQLRLQDVDLEKRMITIRGEYTKTGNSRYAFFSEEAADMLKDWLKHREEYLGVAVKKSRFKKEESTDLLFPFSYTNATQMWTNAVKKNGSFERDSSTGRLTLHPHCLRKFFRTKLGAIISIDVVEALMGHEGYLTEVYRRYSTEDLKRDYEKGEHVLSVFTDRAKIGELEQRIESKDKAMNEIIQGLVRENMELRQRMETIDKQVKEIAPIVKALLGDPEVIAKLKEKLKET